MKNGSLSDYSENARYKLGVSATPYRDMGDDIFIEGCFGRTLYKVTASHLINEGYLVRPDIFFVPMNNMKGYNGVNYADYYEGAIINNAKRNEIITNIADNFYNQDRNILLLVRMIEHGNMLKEMLGEKCEFLHGKVSTKNREKHLNEVRAGNARMTIGTSIADEGIDCKPWDTLILAGSGKSQTRALQRIGRIIRPYTRPDGTEKKNAIAIDFMDDVKYMKGHSLKRKAIYQTEPEFNIDMLQI